MEIKVITRKWGNSIAVVIPRDIIDKEGIKEDEEIVVRVEKRRPLVGELFGKFPRKSKKSAQEIKDELRAGWLNASDREREKKWKKEN